MTRILAAAFALFVIAAQDKPDKPKPPDDFIEIKWDVQKEDHLDFKWTFDFTRKQTQNVKKKDTIVPETTETIDRRDITGELLLKEGENGAPGVIALVLKKIVWTQANRDYDLILNWAEGKKLDVVTKIKGDSESTPQAKEALKAQAGVIADTMKRSVEGGFTIFVDPKRTETIIFKDGVPTKPGPSLFDKIYLHSPIPNQLVRVGQTWKDPLDAQLLPTGVMEANQLDYKLTTANATTATFKAGFQMPIAKAAAGTNEKMSGNFSIGCDFVWNRAGYLQSSKEEMTFTNKVDATGQFAKFYQQDSSATMKQTVTIKRKPPPKDDKKDGGKKSEEKKK